MRVLFVNHTGAVSGAEIALLRLIGRLEAQADVAVACPPEGRLARMLEERAIEHLPIDGTDVSFRLDPRQTSRGLALLAGSGRQLRRLARRWRPDVVHANGVRAGLLALGLRGAPRRPSVVVQVHDNLPRSAMGRAVRLALAVGCDRVIAVSNATARSFDAGLPRRVARRVYISIDHGRFTPRAAASSSVRDALGVSATAPLLGEVAQITPWKGQMTAIEAMPPIVARHGDARLLIVGSVAFDGRGVRYDNRRYERELHERVADLGLDEHVVFTGQRGDVPALLGALDLFLLPSWDEPFGTAALEAMATGTVALVGDSGGVTEYVEDHVSGRILPVERPEAWSAAALELLADRATLSSMGRRAERVAAAFTDETYASDCLRVYRELIDRRAGAALPSTG